MKSLNFHGFSSPIISFTKWVDPVTNRVFYDLYINLQYESRYDSWEDLSNRIELISRGLGGLEMINSDLDFPNR